MIKPYQRAYITAFLLDAAVMIVFATTPFFVLSQMGGNEAMAGMMGAFQMAAYALSCLASSRFVAQVQNGLHWALCGVVLFIFLSCLMPLHPQFIFCGVISSLAFAALGLVWPALHSWIGSESDSVLRARHIAHFNIAAGCGFSLSPLLGGPLYDLDYRYPFGALACIGLIMIALIRSLPPETKLLSTVDAEHSSEQSSHEAVGNNHNSLYIAWSAVFVANILVGATRSVFPKRIMNILDTGELRFFLERDSSSLLSQVPATTFSWLVSVLWIATTICFFIMGRKHCWRHRIHLLLCFQVLAGGAAWILGYTQNLSLMLVCFAIIGVNFGVSFFIAMNYSLADPIHKHRRAATTEGVLGIGCFVGSIGFGYLASCFGVTTPFLYTPLYVGFGIAIQLWLLRRGRYKVTMITTKG